MKINIFHPILSIAFLNFIFVIILLLIFFSFFANPSGFEIRLPSVGAVEMEGAGQAVIRITAENVLYYNDKVVTINDLKRQLLKINPVNTIIYVRMDRRSSMGRVADVWDLCNGLGIAKVKVVPF